MRNLLREERAVIAQTCGLAAPPSALLYEREDARLTRGVRVAANRFGVAVNKSRVAVNKSGFDANTSFVSATKVGVAVNKSRGQRTQLFPGKAWVVGGPAAW